MKKLIRKNILRCCSVVMAASLAAGIAVAATGKDDATLSTASTAAPAGLTDVTGQYDTNELRAQYLNKDTVSVNTVDRNKEYWFIVDLEGTSLLDAYNRTDKYATFADYLSSQEGRARQSELTYAQRKFLATLEKKGIPYVQKYAYTEVMSGLALKLKLKDVSAVEKISGVKAVYTSESYAVPTVAVSNNAHVYSTGIYDTSEVAYKGEGMVVAVLDTGLDYTHPAFQNMPTGTLGLNKSAVENTLSALAAANRSPSVTIDNVYYNEKIPYAYDYADDDFDVYPSYSTHGTHVAGIIAGQDDEVEVNEEGDHFIGVSPEAQLVICKVFTDDLEAKAIGGANSVDILAAISDCVKLGVDVINMSLGTSAGFSDETGVTSGEYVVVDVYKQVEEAGISLVVAASNDYSSGFGGAYGTNLASNPDSGTIGSPSTYASTLSVASINGVPTSYFSVNGKEEDVAFYVEANDANGKKYQYSYNAGNGTTEYYEFLDALYMRAGVIRDGKPDYSQSLTLDYVVVGGVGRTSNYTSSVRNALSNGKTIAVVKRGEINFAEKVQNAMSYGAIGCIIYNNVSGTVRMALGEVNDPIPACSISMDAGNLLLAGGSRGTVTFDPSYSAGPFMSDFSSWGPTPSLNLKPEITAHGGEITSAVPGGYETLSGTSMAAPNMSGAIAILRQYVQAEHPELTAKELNNRVYQLLMSTATMALNEENNPYSPRKQGAGLADINHAIATEAYLTVEGSDKPKAELGDDKKKEGVYKIEFDVNNTSGSAKQYVPDVYVMTESLSSDLKTVAEKAYMLNDDCTIDIVAGGSMVAANGMINVPANGTTHVVVTITLGEQARAYLDETFVNGMFVEGYVRLKDTASNGVELGIPFLAFYGDWQQAPLFDWSMYEVAESEADRTVEEEDKKKASASSSRPLGLYYDGDYIVALGGYLYDFSPTDKEIIATDEHAAISCFDYDNRRTVYEFYMIYAGLLRGAKTLHITIADSATGEVVLDRLDRNVRKSYAAGGTNVGSAVSFNINPAEWNMANNKRYTVTLQGTLDYGDGTALNNDSFSFEFTVDTESPVITDYRIRYEEYKENDETKYRIYLDTDVYDNHYAMSLLPCYLENRPDGTQRLALVSSNPIPIYSTRGGTTTVSFEVTDYYDTLVKTGKLYIGVQDYAMNETLYLVNYVSATAYPDSVTIGTDDKMKEAGLSAEGYTIYNLTLGQYDRYKLDITAQPDSSVAVALEMGGYDGSMLACKEGEIFAVAGSGTTTVMLRDGNGNIKARINVTLTKGNAQKPIIEDIKFESVVSSDSSITKLEGTTLALSVNPNTTTQLVPHVLPWYAEPLYQNVQYEWSSTNETILKVDDKGNVTALRSGNAYIRLSVKGETASKTVYISVENELDVQNYILMHYYGGEEYVIPDNLNIMSIYEEAFQYNTTIRKLTLPISVTAIPENCFLGCVNLEEIVIPSTCTIINTNAFKDCKSLKVINLLYAEDKFTKEDMTGVLTVGRSAFENCTALTTIHNPQRITSAFNRAFAGCTSLTSVDISGMRNVGEAVFEGCTGLKSVTMSSLTGIGTGMFRGCTALTSIEYPASVIAPYTFYGCTALQTITFPATSLSEIGEYAFYNTAFTEITLPDGTYGIGAKAFGACKNLTTVKLSANANISTNGASPFAESASFTAFEQTASNSYHKVRDGILYNSDYSVLLAVPYGKTFDTTYTIPADVREIAAGAFTGTSVNTVDLNNVTVLGAYAFAESTLTGIDVSNIEVIPEGAFYACRSLRSTATSSALVTTNANGESKIKTIGAYALANCTNMRQKLVLPSVVEIGAHAFESTPVTHVSGNEIETIGDYAFYKTNLFTTGEGFAAIDLPRVTSIGAYAFANIGSGFTVASFGAVTAMGERAFADTYLQSFSLAEGATVVGDMAFVQTGTLGGLNPNQYLTTVNLPNSLQTIGEYAFFQATKLRGDVNLSGVKTIGIFAFYGATSIGNLDLSKVETVSAYAFALSSLTEARLESAKVVGDFAFANAPITSLTIPNVERIYPYAFFNTQIKTVEIPSSLNTLTFEEEWIVNNDFGDPEEKKGMMMPSYGAGAFASIPTLESITVAAGNPVYFAEEGVLYARTERGQYILLQYPANKTATEYRVKDGTVRIAEAAFYNVNRTKTRDYLAKVTFPYTVKEIGAQAFFVETSSKTSMVSEYVFESVEAPILEAMVDTQLQGYLGLGYAYPDGSVSAYDQGLFYSNFVLYVVFTVDPTYDWLTIYHPANGRGYDNLIWSSYFKNAVLTEYAQDDASRAFTEMVEALKTPAELENELETQTDKLQFLKDYSEQVVQPVRLAYNAILLDDQLALLQDTYNTLLAVESYLRTARAALGDEVKQVSVTASRPDKYLYYIGEEFDATGIVVQVVYEDLSVVVLDESAYTISGYNTPLTLADNKVIVTYGEFTTELAIQVIEKPADPPAPLPPEEETPKKGCGSEQSGLAAIVLLIALGTAVSVGICVKRKGKN